MYILCYGQVKCNNPPKYQHTEWPLCLDLAFYHSIKFKAEHGQK